MRSCESSQELMADALYGQLSSTLEKELHAHLDKCGACQAIQQELSAANTLLEDLGIANGSFDDIPERASLDNLWQKIEPSLDRVDAERYRELPRRNLAGWSAAFTAIAASVILYFSAFTPDSGTSSPLPPIVSTDPINPDLMNYLDRAQVMLMQVANTESDSGPVIPIRQSFARDMAFEANMLSGGGDIGVKSGQRKLLRDIEFLLLQIANLDESNMAEGVALLQQYLEVNSILFKIRLMEMRNQDLVI